MSKQESRLDKYIKLLEGYPKVILEAEADYIAAAMAEAEAQQTLDALSLDACPTEEKEAWEKWMMARRTMLEAKRELGFKNNLFAVDLAIVGALTAKEA